MVVMFAVLSMPTMLVAIGTMVVRPHVAFVLVMVPIRVPGSGMLTLVMIMM